MADHQNTKPAALATSTRSNSRKPLVRELTLWPLFLIVVANMIGTGIFTTSGFIIKDLGNPATMLVCWLVGGILAIMGALCYGELGAMFPFSGGEYVFLRESFGKRTAFLSGWVSLWVGFSAPIAAAAIAFGNYFTSALPAGASTPWLPSLLAITVILVFTGVHIHGLLFGARVQSVMSSLKIFLILALIAAGAAFGNGSWNNFAAASGGESVFSGKFAVSLIYVSFAYSGWNASAYLGGEIKDPGRNLPLSIIYGTIFVIFLYTALNLLYIYALPAAAMAGVEEVGALAVKNLFGEGPGAILSIGIAFFLLSTLSAMIMTGPRVYYAMAHDRLFFKLIDGVDKAHHIPIYAILLQAGIAIALVLTSSFYMLLMYIGFMLSIFSALTVIGLMILRKKQPDAPRPYRTWGYPVTPLLFIAGNVWVIVFCVRGNPATLLWGGLTLAVGLLVCDYFDGWHLFRRLKRLQARATS